MMNSITRYAFFALFCFCAHAVSAQVSFTANPQQTCVGTMVNFTNTSTDPNAINFAWYFGDGTFSSGYDETHIYTQSATWFVQLIGYDLNWSYIGSDFGFITVGEPFTQNIALNFNSPTCPNSAVQFSVNESNHLSYSWDFGDGSPVMASGSTESHVYSALGNYQVSVVVTDYCGNDTTLTGTVSIINMTNFSGSPSVYTLPSGLSCPNENISFFTESGHQNYAWDMGDGTLVPFGASSMNHSYSAVNTYNFSVTITDVCGVDTTINHSIIVSNSIFGGAPDMNADPDLVCIGSNTFLVATFGFTSYVWDPGDGTAPISTASNNLYHNYSSAASYIASVTITNSCAVDTTLYTTITVSNTIFGGNPSAFASVSTACPNDYITFEATAGYQNYDWNFGDGSPIVSGFQMQNHYYTSFGSYNASVLITNICGADTTLNMTINIVPSGVFQGSPGIFANPTSSCPMQDITFYADWGYAAYVWNFGDGSPVDSVTNTFISHTYQNYSTYNVSLKIYDYCGNDTTLFMSYNVVNTGVFVGNPGLFASQSTVCPAMDVSFWTDWGFYSYVWNFGDGSPSDSTTSTMMDHAFAVDGSYTVSVTIYDYCFNSTVLIYVIDVVTPVFFSGNPVLNVSPATACPGEPVYFDVTFGYPTYIFNYGDGSPNDTISGWPNVFHTYSSFNTFNGWLKIVQDCGPDTTLFFSVDIAPNAVFAGSPYFNIYPSNTVCPTEPVDFVAAGGYQSYVWDYGDGSPLDSTLGNYTGHIYAAVGPYNVSVRIYDYCGNFVTLNSSVDVINSGVFNPPPWFSLNAYSSWSCPNRIEFNTWAINYQSYVWDFGDGTTDSTFSYNTSHFYSLSGPYTATLKVYDYCGNFGVVSTGVFINTTIIPPVVSLVGSADFCLGDSLILISSYLGGNNEWTGGVLSDSLIVYGSGDYSLTVTHNNGCILSTPDLTVNVHQLPVVDAGSDIFICGGSPTPLLGICTTAVDWDWTPASTLNFPNIPDPIAVPTITTTYFVTATDANSCSATDDVVVNILTNAPVTNISASGSTTLCFGEYVTLSTPFEAGVTYTWQVDSNDILGTNMHEINFMQPGNYRVVAVNSCGSDTSTNITVIVNNLPNAVITPSGPTTFCTGASVTLDAGAGFVQYLWTGGSASQTLVVSSSTTVDVTVTDGNGCSATSASVTVDVSSSAPLASISLSGVSTFCAGDSVIITETSGTALTHQWQLNGVNINGANDNFFTAFANGDYRVVLDNGCGADTSLITSVTVNPLPTPVITPSGPTLLCAGGSVDLDAGAGYASYLWTGGASVQTINVASTGTYSVTVTDINGCEETSSSLSIIVSGSAPAHSVSLSGASTFCAGDSITLTEISGTGITYQWQLNTVDISGETGTSFTAFADGDYRVVITNGCGSDTSTVTTVNVNPNPVAAITASGPTNFCVGDNVVLDAGAGFDTYTWSTGESTQTITVVTTEVINVIVSFPTGCSDTSAWLPVNAGNLFTPVISVSGPTEFCAGDSVILDAGAGYHDYLWSNGDTTQTTVIYTAGTYFATVMNNGGCTRITADEIVTVNSLPVPVITTSGSTSICAGDSVSLNAGAGYVSYSWSGGQSVQSIYVSASGSHSVTVEDNNGCVGSSAATSVVVNPNPVPVITQVGMSLQSSVTGVTYQWYMNSQTIAGANGQNFSPFIAGTYSITVIDSNGCSGTSAPFIFTSVENVSESFNVLIYPNPSNGTINISGVSGKWSTELFNSLGQVMLKRDFANDHAQFNLEDFPKGIYSIRIITEKDVMVQKIILQ